MYFKICFIAFVAICLKYTAMADSYEDYKLQFVSYIMDCSRDFPITAEDVLTLKKKQLPDSENVKCLLACSYKRAGMMDADGKLSPEGIEKISNEIFADQPDLKKKSEDFTNACKFVNDEDLTGDKKDCDRAVMIYKCSVERAADFDFTN